MPTRKIRDLSPRDPSCNHPEHNPPGMVSLPPGVYEHSCPACGHRFIFTVRQDAKLDFRG